MKPVPIPEGIAQRILVTMTAGNTAVVRPEHVPDFKLAAKSLGIVASLKMFTQGGRVLYQLKVFQPFAETVQREIAA